jgi:hypothetical protein
MLWVLGALALVWVCLLLAVCAICAVAGTADEQSEDWYREHRRSAQVDQQERGAA